MTAPGAQSASQGVYSVTDFGAAGDGTTLDTAAIQRALDTCAGAGGGTVSLPPGTYLSGTLFLKSHVTLQLENGATLLGSTDLSNYPATIPAFRSYTDNYTDKSLIYAEGLENIAIAGRGIIDGQGAAFKGPYKVRPCLVRIIECRNVRVRDITLRNSPMWVQHYLACEDVTVDGITVHSRVNSNNDGIDIDSCDDVRIANCSIVSGDDAIVLKSTSDRVCRRVTVTNCVVSSNCNAIKLGTESNGGFQDIVIGNCVVYDTRLCGIALELVDGGVFDRVTVSDISMSNVGGCIFIRLGNRARPFKDGMQTPGIGALRNVVISSVQAVDVDSTGCSITGLPDAPVENITLDNIRIVFRGGVTTADSIRDVPDVPEKYPEYRMFGVLPAYGFYCRHAKNIKFRTIELGFKETDHRPALVCDDVSDLDLFDFTAGIAGTETPLIVLRQVDGAFIHGCKPGGRIGTFLRLEGSLTSDISVIGNDFGAVGTVYEAGDGVPENALNQSSNRR